MYEESGGWLRSTARSSCASAWRVSWEPSAAGLLAGPAAAALPVPAPQGDDVGFLSFGAVAETASAGWYLRAASMAALRPHGDRRRFAQSRAAKRDHIARINASLGADAIQPGDFVAAFADDAFASKAGALSLGREHRVAARERLPQWRGLRRDTTPRACCSAACSPTTPSSSRGCAASAARPPATGLPVPLSLEQAGTTLDRSSPPRTSPFRERTPSRAVPSPDPLAPAARRAARSSPRSRSLRRPAPRPFTVYGAASLSTAFPVIDRLADVQLRRLQPAAAPDRARRAGRPLRVGQPGRARGAVPRGQVHAAGHVRDEHPRDGHAAATTRPACAPSTACAPAATASPSAPPACRSATTRASCCGACS